MESWGVGTADGRVYEYEQTWGFQKAQWDKGFAVGPSGGEDRLYWLEVTFEELKSPTFRGGVANQQPIGYLWSTVSLVPRVLKNLGF